MKREVSLKDISIRTFITLGMVCCYILLLFFIPRDHFFLTYAMFSLLFIFYYFVIRKYEILFSLKYCLILAVIFRLIAIFNLPALSDDYFRFLWDGEMLTRHVNPFSYPPEIYIIKHPDPYLKYLFEKMNSGEYYTVYPPILQYIFALTEKFFSGSEYAGVVFMKFFIFTGECLTGLLLYNYCKFKNIPVRNILWYLLNPLIIVELTGNLHFEAIEILFLVATLYFLEKNKIFVAGIFWAFAICTKLLPLMLAPLILNYLGFKRFLKFALLAGMVSCLLFIPFIDPTILNIKDSLGKFYNLFEFNASIYYFINWIGTLFTSRDISDTVAQILGILSFLFILGISFFKLEKQQLLARTLFIFSIYFLSATMVHPWYIATIICFACLEKFKYPIVFSLLIPLSYYPYSLKLFNENMNVIFIEYFILFVYVFLEFNSFKKVQKIWVQTIKPNFIQKP